MLLPLVGKQKRCGRSHGDLSDMLRQERLSTLMVVVYFAECWQCLSVWRRTHENDLIDEKSSQNTGWKRRQFIFPGCGTQHQSISARYNTTRGPTSKFDHELYRQTPMISLHICCGSALALLLHWRNSSYTIKERRCCISCLLPRCGCSSLIGLPAMHMMVQMMRQ